MMLRLLNLLIIGGLLGTAAWAYSIKYETTYYVEQVKKMERRLERERDAINVLKAEWQHVTKPQRLQPLAERHLELQPLQATQIVRAGDLPKRRERNDAIAEKIDQLVTGTITPGSGAARPGAGTRTPLPPVRPATSR
jgi:cell division protein FtsL